MALWQQCLRVDYQPVIHVSAIAKHHDPKDLIPEILKYQVKESDLVGDREWFLELTRQLHKTRAIAVSLLHLPRPRLGDNGAISQTDG